MIHVRVAFRPGHPEIPWWIKGFDGLLGTDINLESNPHTDFALEPGPDEIVVTKRFYSAFGSSDLDTLLRAAGVRQVVLAGLATAGVVLSTARDALEHGYRALVLADACADLDPEVHRVLIEKVLPTCAMISTVDEWTGALRGVCSTPAAG